MEQQIETKIEALIEALRQEMVETAAQCGTLSNERVMYVSQLLDRYIVIYQKLMQKKRSFSKRSSA